MANAVEYLLNIMHSSAPERGDTALPLKDERDASEDEDEWADASASMDMQPSASVPAVSSVSVVSERADGKDRPTVLGVVVVDFNHIVGPQVEYTYPLSLKDNHDLCTKLPFLALPDGSHLHTVFGISCNRQITSDSLISKTANVTRSVVQKAIVILATQPIFGSLRTKLGMVTRAFFAQRDFSNVALLEEFHEALESSIGRRIMQVPELSKHVLDASSALYMGTSLRQFVHRWRFKVLILVKLLLLQGRILFFGYPVELLCTLQYNLVALIPALLPALQDAGSPELDTWSTGRRKAESLKMSDRESLLLFMGLPLPVFGQDAFFQPCCPLQQMELLSCTSWLVGTTNSIFKQQRPNKPSVIVDLEQTQLQFLDPHLQSAVWMDDLINVVSRTWNEDDASQPSLMQYEGSDDYIRARFEEYIFAFLATAKEVELSPPRPADTPMDPNSPEMQFGVEAIDGFRASRVFKAWHATTDETLPDLIGCKHPCQGKVTALSDVALRVQEGIQDLRIEGNLAPTREAIGAALQAGSAGISKVASTWRSDLARIRQGWESPRTPTAEDASQDASALSPGWDARKQEAFNTLQATGAQGYAALGAFGNFLSVKQKALAASMRARDTPTPE
ncbi:hypothetical protein MVES1_001934 [Malassezia vespertilionis]|uniref:uncharacterized protein n=1 Tax=Malassezia vespertilionis TaxID=2020962 RepID=UPI0024B27D52|nr:uncharacterized protein MVES1_001934 [Malassezia vespertilionis]WFD06582.1 hypothetical protein MVES1_001934 [Malassezia vespertilionis]